MDRIALHTRLKPGKEADYDRIHPTIPADLDVALREAGDEGTPIVLADPDSPSAVVLRSVARTLAARSRGLAGRSLGLSPVTH